MNIIFRYLSARKLFDSRLIGFLERQVLVSNSNGPKHMLYSGLSLRYPGSFNGSLRFFNNTTCLNEQSSSNVKDAVAAEEHTDKSEELDSKIANYLELATDVEKKKKILMILMEHEVAKLEGKRVPSRLTVDDMRELLNLFSFSSRLKYSGFLFTKECAKSAERRRKELKRKEYEAWLIEKENIKPSDHLEYGIGKNTLLLRVRRKSVMRYYNQRLSNASMFGQKLILDMDYDCFMRRQDCNNCSEQLLELYSANRRNPYPFDLYFCNARHDDPTMRTFRRYMPNLYAPDNFITLTDLSYLDIFPKEELIYITPYAKEPMKTFDQNATYIIGGLVDKCIREPVVMAKAKREGVKAVHLPYEDYVMWGRGSKSLPLNHIIQILLAMKASNDWQKAFQYVPQRKLVRSLDLFSEFSTQ